MRLRSVTISRYKNLRDFSLDFEGDEFIDIFVGKNGCGKSNFLEALIEIFHFLYADGDSKAAPNFDFSIEWEIGAKRTNIQWRTPRSDPETPGQLTINGRARKTIGKTPSPQNVLVYYSGQNQHVARIVRQFEDSFRGRIKGAEVSSLPDILGITPALKELLVWLILLLPEDRPARRFVCDKLGILGNKEEAEITLTRPIFANKATYDPFVAEDLFWGTQGFTRDFINELLRCVRGGVTPGALYDRDKDSYTIPINLELYRRVFAGRSAGDLFRHFCAFHLLGMLGDLNLTVTIHGFETPDLSQFSDGQFQSVYVFAVSELFKDIPCITLLDEPDAFLHPEWQYDFLSQVLQISEEAERTNHILMSSHSASTIAAKVDTRLRVFEVNDRQVTPAQKEKSEIINSLSAGLISFSEAEAQLSIHHVLESTQGPVVFTEGVTDAVILEIAWEKLFGARPRPFEIQGTFGCGFLGALLREESIYNDHPNRMFFGVFDFDEAYNNWNSNNTVFVQQDVTRGLVRRKQNHPGFFILLPVPPNLSVRAQVVNPANGEHYRERSALPIELLFHDAPGLAEHFCDDQSRPGNIRKLRCKKTVFARQVVPDIDAEHFECFRPVFEFIEAQINADVEVA